MSALPSPKRSAEFWIEVASLSVSTLYLDRNQAYRGQCALVFDPRHVEGLERLESEEYVALSDDLRRAGRAIAAACGPDLMKPLLQNAGLGAGGRVDLTDTSVDCADVAALEAKGVEVTSDCP